MYTHLRLLKRIPNILRYTRLWNIKRTLYTSSKTINRNYRPVYMEFDGRNI